MAQNHQLQARIANVKIDARARRRHALVEAERRWHRAQAWWHRGDKRIVAIGAGAAVAASLGAIWLARKE